MSETISTPARSRPWIVDSDPRIDVLAARLAGDMWSFLNEGGKESFRSGARTMLAELDYVGREQLILGIEAALFAPLTDTRPTALDEPLRPLVRRLLVEWAAPVPNEAEGVGEQ